MEHFSTDFGNLGLSSSRGGGIAGSSAGEWPRQQPVPCPPPRNTPPSQYPNTRSGGFRGSNSNNNMPPSVLRSGSHDWQQLESDLNAATAKEFVPGHGWNTQQQQQLPSSSSVASNSHGECDFWRRASDRSFISQQYPTSFL
jgi:hypothetical protein